MPKQHKKKGAGEFKFIIEKVDIDGDGSIDGVLIKRYSIDNQNNKHFVDQKFVPNHKLEEEFIKYKQLHPEFQVDKEFNSNPRANGGVKIAGDKVIAKLEDGGNIPMTQKVIIQDDTSFFQYVKQGVGVSAGFAITDIVTGLFSGE